MKIRELFSDETKWTKGTNARNSFNDPVSPHDLVAAEKYCLQGAVIKCYGFVDRNIYKLMKNRLLKINDVEGDGPDEVVAWNDAPERTFEEVKKLVEELDI